MVYRIDLFITSFVSTKNNYTKNIYEVSLRRKENTSYGKIGRSETADKAKNDPTRATTET